MLVSVPYALKAADAETLGGWPASSFVRIEEAGGETPQVGGKADREGRPAPNKALVPITGLGVADYLARFTSSSTLRPSLLFDNGTYIGVKTASPRTDFHVNGTVAAKRLTPPR